MVVRGGAGVGAGGEAAGIGISAVCGTGAVLEADVGTGCWTMGGGATEGEAGEAGAGRGRPQRGQKRAVGEVGDWQAGQGIRLLRWS